MCLAIPARIVELLAGDQCRVELGGVRKEISLALSTAPPSATT